MDETNPSETEKIVIVEDHQVVREGISTLIGEQEGLEVVAQVPDARAAKEQLEKREADLAIIDLELPGQDGLELIDELKERHPSLKLLVLSAYEESLYAERCLAAGAGGYIMKKAATRELIEAIRQVMQGQLYVSRAMSDRILRRFVGGSEEQKTGGVNSLSNRELEVFRLIGRGLSPREIADKLEISVKTVESHREHIKNKIGAANARELLQRATLWLHRSEEP
jgi:DNA-binding NarL/FixJ family response regulator